VLPADTEVVVRTECILFGQRVQKGHRMMIPTNRVEDLFAGGLVASQAQIDRLWANAGRLLSPRAVISQYQAAPYDPSALKVLQLTSYDPGSSVYRYSSAANVAGLTSVLVRYGHSNAHCDLRDYDTEVDARILDVLYDTADVVHSHMDYYVLRNILRKGTRDGLMQALTYHGSVDPSNVAGSIRVNEGKNDDRMDAIVFGARPYHHRYGVKHWLPIPMPVDDYQVLAKEEKRTGKVFRVAHSPTMRRIKGTQEFLKACDYLKMHEGINIEPVLIENLEHGEALRLKASCDAVFDSFWLGMQGSGLEGGAMGMPVLAGDPEAQNDLIKLGIPVPWTIANDETGLRDALAKLATDRTFYAAEAARVHAYVRQYHDYPVVGKKYADILTEAKRNGPPYRQ
jgi:glycosyltransferase involved in cell wall biosynthesis